MRDLLSAVGRGNWLVVRTLELLDSSLRLLVVILEVSEFWLSSIVVCDGQAVRM